MLIDKISRIYCTDAQANDISHLESDHRSVTAHFYSRALRRNKDWTANIGIKNFAHIQDTRDNLHQWKHAKIPSHPKIQEIERRYDELAKRFIGKHEAAAHAESDILEKQQTTTAAATNKDGEILEQQHTTTTAAHREETIDSKDQEL